jgi:hypothetical protein
MLKTENNEKTEVSDKKRQGRTVSKSGFLQLSEHISGDYQKKLGKT